MSSLIEVCFVYTSIPQLFEIHVLMGLGPNLEGQAAYNSPAHLYEEVC